MTLNTVAKVATSGAALAYLLSSNEPDQFPYSLTNQSRLIPGPERIRTSQFTMGLDLSDTTPDGSRTLAEGFAHGVALSGDNPCLGTRDPTTLEYKWLSYNQVHDRAVAFGAGLRHLGVEPIGGRVGLYSPNRSEWVIAEQGCNVQSIVTVPLYDTLGAAAVEHIVNQAELAVVVCDQTKVDSLMALAPNCPTLRIVIVMDGPSGLGSGRTGAPIDVRSFADIEALGRQHPCKFRLPSPHDWATICYTSGTTGLPKGAILTHRNMISQAAGCLSSMTKVFALTNEDVHISYLPLAHMFERSIQMMIFIHGGQIGFFRGDITMLVDDIQALKPTLFPSVPRLLNRVYDKVMAGVSESAFSTFMFNRAMQHKRGLMNDGVMRNDTMWDQLVFKKVREVLGGRVRFVATGAAPISSETLTFLRAALGCHVLEGYGQTEGAAGATLTLAGDYTEGHVGPPLSCCHIKVVDVPEMNYFAKDDKGEICFRGPNVFVGYLNNEGKTKETIDEDGWVHTGDIGEWTPYGTLKIIDRKKNIFKLAQGEYIAPEKIENVYTRLPTVAQMYVHGESLESKLVGIAVPDEDTFIPWCKTIIGSAASKADVTSLCQNKKIISALKKSLRAAGDQGGLASFEQVAAIYLHPELFSVENGLLTPTFKAKRPQLKQRFATELAAMYAHLHAQPQAPSKL